MMSSKIGKMLAVLLVGAAVAGVTAWADVSGSVTAVAPGAITVDGAVYKIEATTTVETLAGEHASLSELRPGTPVELDFDEEGKLAIIHATLVR